MSARMFFAVTGLLALTSVAAAQEHKVREISLERTPCFGACPVYKVTLKPDGTVVYEGKRFVEKIGRFEGKTTPETVAKLYSVANKLGFWGFKDKYTAQITDMPSALVTIDCGTRKKTTDNYADQGPLELWTLEQLIDKVVLDIKEWKKAE